MKINKIHHVAIICSDYERSKEFYTKILGFEIIREIYREKRESHMLHLKVGDHYQIELFSFPETPPRVTNPEACGLRHLAFEVDDVEKVKSELEAKDIKTEEIRLDSQTGKKLFFFRDPDDLVLEIYEK